MTSLSQKVASRLSEERKPFLLQEVSEIHEQHNRSIELVGEKLDLLKAEIFSRDAHEQTIVSVGCRLEEVQRELKTLVAQPLGPLVDHAEDRLAQFQMMKDKVKDLSEEIANLDKGQSRVDSELYQRLDTTVEMHSRLTQQIDQHLDNCKTSLNNREQLYWRLVASEELVEDCLNQIDLAEKEPMAQRIHTYKTLKEQTANLEAEFVVLSDQARGISQEGSEESVDYLDDRLGDLKQKTLTLKQKSTHGLAANEQLQESQTQVEALVSEMVTWFEMKEAGLSSHDSLQLESKHVDGHVDKLETLKQDVDLKVKEFHQMLSEVESKNDNFGARLNLEEKSQTIDTLQASIMGAVSDKEEFLNEAKTDRLQLESSLKQVSGWLTGVESLLDSGYDGIDYDTLEHTLSHFSDYLSESSLCQDELEHASELSEKVSSSLSPADRKSLSHNLAALSRRYDNDLVAANNKTENMEAKLESWKQFHECLSGINHGLNELETEWNCLNSNSDIDIDNVTSQYQKVKDFADNMTSTETLLSNLNDLARDLERSGSSQSCETISRLVRQADQRWEGLTQQTQETLDFLQELDAQCLDFRSMMACVETVVCESQTEFRVTPPDQDGLEQIRARLETLSKVETNLSRIEPQLSRLQSSSLILQNSLPTAHAKIATQDRFLKLQETYNSLRKEVGEEHDLLKVEIAEMEGAHNQLDQKLSWLQGTIDSVQSLTPPDRQEEILPIATRLRAFRQDLAIHTQETQTLEASINTKHTSGESHLSQDVVEKLDKFYSLKDELGETIDKKEEELLHLKANRAEYDRLLNHVTTSMTSGSDAFQQEVADIAAAKERHKAWLADVEELKTDLNQLRCLGGALIQHSPDQHEKQKIQKQLASTNTGWLSLQAQTVERSQKISEAEDLTHAVKDVARGVELWCQEAELCFKDVPKTSNAHSVEEQLLKHRKIHKEIWPNKDKVLALHSMVKQLQQLVTSDDQVTMAADLSERVDNVQAVNTQQLSELELTNAKFETFEKEVGELMCWLERARSRLTMRDTTLELHQQLEVQQKLLNEVVRNREKSEEVLANNPEVVEEAVTYDSETSGDVTLTQASHLKHEMDLLEEATRDQRDALQLAVKEQEKYDNEIKFLTNAISDASQKLETSPVRAKSVSALRHQITEHNKLAGQIQDYQTRMNEVNEKSLELARNSAHLSPALFRKHYLPESAFSDFFSAAYHTRTGSPLPSTSGALFFDTLPTFDTLNPISSPGVLEIPDYPDLSNGQREIECRLRDMDRRLSRQLSISDEHLKPKPATSFDFETSRILDRDQSDLSLRRLSAFSVVPMNGATDKSKSRRSASLDSGLDTNASSSHLLGLSFSPGDSLKDSSTLEHSLKSTDIKVYVSTSPETQSLSSARSPREELMAQERNSRHSDLSPNSISTSTSLPSTVTDSWRRASESNLTTPGLSLLRQTNRRASLAPAHLKDNARERSSSFGGRVMSVEDPLRRPQQPDKQIQDLNLSWTSLQQQVISKEKELQAALSRQENYQQSVQALTSKMEIVTNRLTTSPASLHTSLDAKMLEYKETKKDLESIKEDISRVREQSEGIMGEPESEDSVTLQATLTMLVDRYDNLQTMLADRGKQLQEAMQHKEEHAVLSNSYKGKVKQLLGWLDNARAIQSSVTLHSEDPHTLTSQLQANVKLVEDINSRMELLSDLAIQCDAVCEWEEPKSADRLRHQLTNIQNDLAQFKQLSLEKQSEIRTMIKECERRHREMADHDSSVQRLQQWITDTKELSRPADSLHLYEDSKQIDGKKEDTAVLSTMTKSFTTEQEIALNWERLNQELATKLANLKIVLNKNQNKAFSPARHTDYSRQFEEVQGIMGDLRLSLSTTEDRQGRKEVDPLTFQLHYQAALRNGSSWLELAQEQLLTVPSTTEEHIRLNKNVQRDIRTLQSEIDAASNEAGKVLSPNNNNQRLIDSCLASLKERVQLLTSRSQSQEADVKQADADWRQYQADVLDLQRKLQETQRLVLAPASTQSLDQLLENNQKIEAQLKKCDVQLGQLKSKESELRWSHPKTMFNSELTTLQANFMDLQKRAEEKKQSLQKSASTQDQYVKLLKDYQQFLSTGQHKLKSEAISARDLQHLKQLLAAHKDFFSELEVHKAILDSLAGQCDKTTRDQYHDQHAELSSLTHVLVDQASLHGQRLERLSYQWSDLDEKYVHLQTVLSSIESQVPRPIASGDSLTTVQDKLARYRRLQGELGRERGAVFEVVDRGKQILHSVNCPTLETAVTDMAEKWVALNTDLTHELKRTESLGDQLSLFETQTTVFSSWLTTAKMKLSSLKQLSPADQRCIAAVRTQVEKVLEFHKEIENQLPLKLKILSIGQQLLENKDYDTRGLSDRLTGYQEEWSALERGVRDTQAWLHEVQMKLMPSRQALSELEAWMEEISRSLTQDSLTLVKTVADIELMVKKYKGYKVELTTKQMTLDFVNQSNLAPRTDEQEVTHEKMEFVEKLGDLNTRWMSLSRDVSDRLSQLESLRNRWQEYEKCSEKLQLWINQQEDKLTRYKLIGHDSGVKHTLHDCKIMRDQLKAKEGDLESVKNQGQGLIELSHKSPGCQQSVRDNLRELEASWSRLQHQIQQLENLLTDMSDEWSRYQTDLSDLDKLLTQTQYYLNQHALVGGDLDTLTAQVNKLKSLKGELAQGKGQLESFVVLGSRLRQVCEPPVQLDIQKTVASVQDRWTKLSADLNKKLEEFERHLGQWQIYQNHYKKICDWLDDKETMATKLINMLDQPINKSDTLAKSNLLQGELDNIQSQMFNLYRLGDQLTASMSPSSIALITSQQASVEQRLVALRQVLAQHVTSLSDDVTQMDRFNQAFQVVKNFLDQADKTLRQTDPGKKSEQDVLQRRLDELRDLMRMFTNNMTQLDTLNDIGYRLALKESDATRLLDLNHRWQELYEDASGRCRCIQGDVLSQQDFTSKCQTWMSYLAETDRELTTDVGGSLTQLMLQLKQCEKFQNEMYSRQQVLHAIISDGQKMINNNEVENVPEFQQKLHVLAEQWQNVIRRANHRRAFLEDLIDQWQHFESLDQHLTVWLEKKTEGMEEFGADALSLQSVRSLGEKVRVAQREFELQEGKYEKLHQIGEGLIERADRQSATRIRKTLDRITNSWSYLFNNLDSQLSRSDDVNQQWLDCEEEIDDILDWLREIRTHLYAPIPSMYDELQRDVTRCKDIARSFLDDEDKKQQLLAKEKQVCRLVSTEDANLLRERVKLLSKQWEELQRQTVVREQQLADAMFRWSNLGDRLRSLMSWIESMESRVLSPRDLQVEDLLNKLETDYKDEMSEQERTKADIVEQGRQLMTVSSEIRASDLEQKMLRLEDKWKHLVSVVEYRHRKLKETVLAVRQLDISMKNLNQWLSQVELELSGGISYTHSGMEEIRCKLDDTHDLQQDIEKHASGVSAVLNLCQVLLHDADACPTHVEFAALQHAMNNLETRWKKICSLSPQRRSRVEETWQLWETFRRDCNKFSDFLSSAEREVSSSKPQTANVSITKKEIKKYEKLQRRVYNHLADLERINKQYRLLAKEGRTDKDGSLKVMVTELNNRWDALQLNVTEIMKSLRHSDSIRQDFETTRDSLVEWLRDVEGQLDALDSLPPQDVPSKLVEIRRIEEEIQAKRHRMQYVDQAALYLMQKGDSREALTVQHQLDEFHQFSKTVLERVLTLQLRVERLVVAQVGPYEAPTRRMTETERQERHIHASPVVSPVARSRTDASPSRVAFTSNMRTGSPVRRPGSLVSRSRSPSPVKTSSPRRSPTRQPLDQVDAPRGRGRASILNYEKASKVEVLMEQLVEALDACNLDLGLTEKVILESYVEDPQFSLQQLEDCEASVEEVKSLYRLLTTESGVQTIASADTQVQAVLDRWERVRNLAIKQDFRSSQERHDLARFTTDLDNMLAWLDEAEALQATHRPLHDNLFQLDRVVRNYRDFLVQLEDKKAIVLSINLLSRSHLHGKTPRTKQLLLKLQEMNRRWELVVARAEQMQADLQDSLVQCEAFHKTIDEYQMWLDKMESRMRQFEPVNLNSEQSVLWEKYRALLEIQVELERNQTKVYAMKETADELLATSDSTELLVAKDKTHLINNRLRTLLHHAAAKISGLENKLHVGKSRNTSSSLSESRTSGVGSSSRSSTPRARTRSPFAVIKQYEYGY